MKTQALTHVAMAVPRGTLTPAFRDEVLSFYGAVFGWREMDGLSTAERLTVAVAPQAYINVRETDAAEHLAYEHFGVLVTSADSVASLWEAVRERGVDAEPIERPVNGFPSFRFRHLLPMAIEVQYFPDADRTQASRAGRPT